MTFQDLKLRVRALIGRRRVERELDQELAFHIERETLKQIANGLTPANARTRARARFGSRALAADQCRDRWGRTRSFPDGAFHSGRGVRTDRSRERQDIANAARLR